VLGVALVVAAGGALIDEANGARLHPEQWLGAAAAVCGVGLVVGAFRGRARWLIVPAAILAGTGFVAGEAARTGIEPTALVGDEHVWIGDGSSGPRREHVVLGTVDVSIDAAPAAPVTVDARAGIGEVRIWAADDVTIEVDAGVRRGHVDVEGVRRPDGTFRIGPEGPADVVVHARVGRGTVHVEQWRREAFVPPAPLPPPGPERFVADGVLLTAGGQIVIAGGEAVIDRDDTVLTGTTVVRDRATVITTSFGDFRLLPGGLLLTPDGTLVDLPALRARLVPLDAPATADAPATPDTPDTPDTPAPPGTTPGG